MRTLVFYSYKGGVGRTLAAVNLAVYAARVGVPTALLDFDLDAPGVMAKLRRVPLEGQPGQPGLLDHILAYQETGQPAYGIQDLARRRPPVTGEAPLWVLPAGEEADYLDRLGRLDWRELFSASREGVAFFQSMLGEIGELGAELLVIDARSGQSEIAGLCTHQLADEVIVMTAPTAEGLDMTHKVLEQIEKSEVARLLGKARRTHVVLSRVPRDADLYWEHRRFSRPGRDLFAVEPVHRISTSPALEKGEFLAMLEPRRDAKLTEEYLALFRYLAVTPDPAAIDKHVRAIAADLLSVPVTESEARLVDLHTLSPIPALFGPLVRFYQLSGRNDEAIALAWEQDREQKHAMAADLLAEVYREPLLSRQKLDLAPEQLVRLAQIFWSREEWQAGVAAFEALQKDAALALGPTKGRQLKLEALAAYRKLEWNEKAVHLAESMHLWEVPLDLLPDLVRRSLEHRSLREQFEFERELAMLIQHDPAPIPFIARGMKAADDFQRQGGLAEFRAMIRRADYWPPGKLRRASQKEAVFAALREAALEDLLEEAEQPAAPAPGGGETGGTKT